MLILVTLPVVRALGLRHHCKTSRVNALIAWLGCLGGRILCTLILLARLLFLAIPLLHVNFSALFPVARTLIVELVVLCYDT